MRPPARGTSAAVERLLPVNHGRELGEDEACKGRNRGSRHVGHRAATATDVATTATVWLASLAPPLQLAAIAATAGSTAAAAGRATQRCTSSRAIDA